MPRARGDHGAVRTVMTRMVSIEVPQRLSPALRDVGAQRHDVGPAAWARLSPVCADGIPCGTGGHQSGIGVASVHEVLVNELDDSVTGLIRAWNTGDTVAGDRLFSRVYAELRSIARRLHRRTTLDGDDTLDTTALVHEVYLRLAGAEQLDVRNRAHFFAIAVRASRQIVSNYARNAQAAKRGGDMVHEPVDTLAGARLASSDDAGERAAALEEALQHLERLHPRPCRVVECRYFGGLSITETALVLDVSEATVKRDWALAQAWLHRALRDSGVTDDR